MLSWKRDVGEIGEPFRAKLEKARKEAEKPWWKREQSGSGMRLREENRYDIDIYDWSTSIEAIEKLLDDMEADYLSCVTQHILHPWVGEEEIVRTYEELAKRMRPKQPGQ